MHKICAVIPAYNVDRHVGQLIRKIKNHNIDIVIIDDCSQDATASAAEKEGVYLIRRTKNGGKGAALRDGFDFALTKGYELIVTLDADGQHNPDEIEVFLDKISGGNAGIVIGNRLHNPKDMPRRRLFVNKLFSKIISSVCGQNIPDALSGYRIIKKDVLKKIVLTSDRFDIDPEILIDAAKKGYIIDSIDIESIYSAERSNIRPFADTYRFFKLIFNEMLWN